MGSIESTIASFQIMLNPFDCHKTTLASFRDALHTNSANHTVPRHKVPPTPKNARKQIYCSLLQKQEIPETAEILDNFRHD
jgi:hypothetical protein